MGGSLVSKLVKATKVFCFWPPDQGGGCEFWLAQAQSHVGAAAAGILRKADATMRQELRRLNLLNGGCDTASKSTSGLSVSRPNPSV